MVRAFPTHVTDHIQSAPLALGLFISIFALVALCAKRATNSPKTPTNDHNNFFDMNNNPNETPVINNNKMPKSAMSTPKRLLSTLSNISIRSNNKKNNEAKEDEEMIEEAKDTFGEGGLWQKNILMGEKCQPLEYSGVIYYDNNGNRTEIPRSPRVSSVVNPGSFSVPFSSRSSIDLN